MTSIYRNLAFIVVCFFMCLNVSAKENIPPQYLLDFKELLEKVDLAWARSDIQSIKKESAAYKDKNGYNAGALSLEMFIALYCERDWNKADVLYNTIIRLCRTPSQRMAVTEVLQDICNMTEWKEVVEDDELYSEAIAELKRVFKDKFPGSESSLLVEVAFYRSGQKA